jgi:osmotically-inducible protein OsmY
MVALAAAGPACAATTPVPRSAPESARGPQAADAIQRSMADDPRITQTLLRELERDPVVSQERISVNVDLGVVTLQGAVPIRLVKDRAVQIAGVVCGVRSIVDRIEVTPHPRPAYELEALVAGALARDPVTAGQPVVVRSHGDVVELGGEVDCAATRRIAESDALAVEGVRDVVDDLAVRLQHVPEDRLVREVARIVRDDPWLDAPQLEVSARGHVAVLTGRVGSGAERARAEWDARSAGVAGVDLSGLAIDDSMGVGTRRASPDATPSDAEIAQALRDAYVIDPRMQAFTPTIDVRQRVVVLTGAAPDEQTLRAADEDARNVLGVADVHDHLKERRALVVENDQAVLSEVEAAFARDPRFCMLPISLRVRRGRVFLRGTVPTQSDRLHAVALATTAPGAADIDDGLVVVPRSLARQ